MAGDEQLVLSNVPVLLHSSKIARPQESKEEKEEKEEKNQEQVDAEFTNIVRVAMRQDYEELLQRKYNKSCTFLLFFQLIVVLVATVLTVFTFTYYVNGMQQDIDLLGVAYLIHVFTNLFYFFLLRCYMMRVDKHIVGSPCFCIYLLVFFLAFLWAIVTEAALFSATNPGYTVTFVFWHQMLVGLQTLLFPPIIIFSVAMFMLLYNHQKKMNHINRQLFYSSIAVNSSSPSSLPKGGFLHAFKWPEQPSSVHIQILSQKPKGQTNPLYATMTSPIVMHHNVLMHFPDDKEEQTIEEKEKKKQKEREKKKEKEITLFQICSICLAEFAQNDDTLKIPGCQHSYHYFCLRPWLVMHDTCPNCNIKF